MTDCRSVIEFDPPTESFDLCKEEGWPEARHQFDGESTWAVRAALATGRPLLVRGEPGTGKSQLARAVATVMQRPLLYEVVNSRTEVTDLLYQFDAVARLAEAQIQGASKADKAVVQEALQPERFVRPGKVWWAINWTSATVQANRSGAWKPTEPDKEAWKRGCVLLVDEIDKAESELPNALLECFANQSFQVPYLPLPVGSSLDQPPPLVVVTTNEERELPAPFLRRCLVLHLALYDDDDKLKQFLVSRGRVHFDAIFKGVVKGYDTVLDEAAKQLIGDRKNASSGAIHRPGQAEYLDLCRAVFQIAGQKKHGSAEEILGKVAQFAFRKNQK